MAADKIFEFGVITPPGNIKTINACSNSDLFSAFRGVGAHVLPPDDFLAECCAVRRRIDLRPHALRNSQNAPYALNDLVLLRGSPHTPSRDPFWQAMTYYRSRLPRLVKSGLMGYFNIHSISLFEPSISPQESGSSTPAHPPLKSSWMQSRTTSNPITPSRSPAPHTPRSTFK